MAFEQNEGGMSIFKNDKMTSDKSPAYRGTGMLDGKKMKFSLWVKEGKSGKFFSGKVEWDTYVSNPPSPTTRQVGTPIPTINYPTEQHPSDDLYF